MKAYKATIDIYAENENEVAEFEKMFYDFVNEKRNQGVVVSAKKVSDALSKFKNNFFVTNYLK